MSGVGNTYRGTPKSRGQLPFTDSPHLFLAQAGVGREYYSPQRDVWYFDHVCESAKTEQER